MQPTPSQRSTTSGPEWVIAGAQLPDDPHLRHYIDVPEYLIPPPWLTNPEHEDFWSTAERATYRCHLQVSEQGTCALMLRGTVSKTVCEGPA